MLVSPVYKCCHPYASDSCDDRSCIKTPAEVIDIRWVRHKSAPWRQACVEHNKWMLWINFKLWTWENETMPSNDSWTKCMHHNSQLILKLVQGFCGDCALLGLLQQALQSMRHPLLHHPVPAQESSLHDELCSGWWTGWSRLTLEWLLRQQKWAVNT